MDFNGEDHKISLSIKAMQSGGQHEADDEVADVDIENYDAE